MKTALYWLSLRLPITPVRRYMLAMFCYGSVAKLANIIRCQWAKIRRHVTSTSRPFVLALDSANGCNLRCPYCLTGKGLSDRAEGEIDLAVLDKLLDEVGDTLLLGNIGNWGEPFLGDRVADVVAALHRRRIFTTISTNFSFRRPDLIRAACDAGLDYLIVSVDGATQPVYQQYRRNGRLDLVRENIALVLDHRHRMRRATPIIEWQFVRFRHNAHEVEAARAAAYALGVDIFRVVPGVAPAHEEVPGREWFQPRARDTYCQQLWHSVILNPDGGIAPCCYLYKDEENFGSIRSESFAEIVTNARYRSARALFGREAEAIQAPKDHPCLRCEVYLNRNQAGAETVPAAERIIGRRLVGDGISAPGSTAHTD